MDPATQYTSDNSELDGEAFQKLETPYLEDDPKPVVDLSNDIIVNQYMADAGAPFNPDAEILDDIDLQLTKKSSQYGNLI